MKTPITYSKFSEFITQVLKRERNCYLTKSTVEDEGIFALNLLNKIRDFIQEGFAREMEGSSNMSIVTSLIITAK